MNIEHLNGGSIRRTDDPGEPTTGKPRISIADDEIDILTEAARGQIVLEIGTGLGVSTRAMAVSAQTVITVDPDPWVAETIAPTFPDDVLHIATLDDIPTTVVFTMAFIDGDHSTESTNRDILAAWERVMVGGRIYVHDAKYPNVAAALTGYGWKHIPTTHGLAYLTV
jgi:predicted O-methyltransferase YrrM